MTRDRKLDTAMLSEAEIHAFVDGLLGAERHASVKERLRADPDQAARARDLRDLNAGLREAFGTLQPPSPAVAALTEKLARARDRQRTARQWATAAAVTLVVASSLGTWQHLGGSLFERATRQEQTAALDPTLFGGPLFQQVDVLGEGETGNFGEWLSPWAANVPATAPDLIDLGFTLSGQRLLTTTHGPAVQLVYADEAGAWVTLLITISEGEGPPRASTVVRSGQRSLFWRDGALVYGLIGNVRPDVLLLIARTIETTFGIQQASPVAPPAAGTAVPAVKAPLEPTTTPEPS